MAKEGDISKQLYKFQEGITAIALELAGYPTGSVHWPASARPEGLTVDVDVLIGPSPEKATHNISIKHMGSGKESEKGSWRMMREVLDSKANCKKVSIFNVFFDSAAKENWEAILASFFDGFLALPNEAGFGPILINKAYDYCRGSLKKISDAEARKTLRQAVNKGHHTYDHELSQAARVYGKALAKMLKSDKKGLDTFWRLLAALCTREIPRITPRMTCFKRGLAKLLILEPDDRAKVYAFFRHGEAIDDLPKYTIDLGLAEEGLCDWEIVDQDIINLFSLLPADAASMCEGIYKKSPVDRMNQLYVEPLRQIENVLRYFDYVENHFAELCDPTVLCNRLLQCFRDPLSLLGHERLHGVETTVWLYKVIVSSAKAERGTKQSSGYARLAEEAGLRDGVSQGYITLADFVNRKSDLKESDALRKMVAAIARPLALHLASVGLDRFRTLRDDTRVHYIQRLLEAQLIPYRQFDPIGITLKAALKKRRLECTHHSSFQTCAREFAQTRAGGTTKILEVHVTPPVMIMWQSPNKNARDKAKEFAARTACVKVKYDARTGRFVDRGVRVFMVIDGIWDKNDIESLLRFGCEAVYYPDEIGDLIQKIEPRRGGAIDIPEEEMPLAADGEQRRVKLKRKRA